MKYKQENHYNLCKHTWELRKVGCCMVNVCIRCGKILLGKDMVKQKE